MSRITCCATRAGMLLGGNLKTGQTARVLKFNCIVGRTTLLNGAASQSTRRQ